MPPQFGEHFKICTYKQYTKYDFKVIPILEPEFVADETVKAILMNKPVLILPAWCNLLITLKSLIKSDPYIKLAQTFGLGCSMDQFEGRVSPSKEIENVK